MGGYDLTTAEFEAETQRLWRQVEPLYEPALSCARYVGEHYGEAGVAAVDTGALTRQHVGPILVEIYPFRALSGVAPLM